MMQGRFVPILLTLTGCAAFASTMPLRDAPGGVGQIFEGTFAEPEMRIDILGPREMVTGTYDYEFQLQGHGEFQSLMTYCAEPDALITFGNYPEDTVGLDYELESLDALEGLSGDEFDFLEILWFNAFEDSITSEVKAAAFQGLIWELVLDDEFDLSSGNFHYGPSAGAVQTQAAAYAANIQNQTWTQAQPLAALTHPISQDFLIPIPEPNGLVMLFVIGAARMIRRR